MAPVDPTPRIEAIARRLGALGCSQEQIDAVQRDQGLPLPRSYEAFLRFLGRDCGGLFQGTDVGFPAVLGQREDALDVLERCRGWKTDCDVLRLPNDAIVISMHQGYVILFLRTSLGDDPPVELWLEGSDHPERSEVIYASVGDWLEG